MKFFKLLNAKDVNLVPAESLKAIPCRATSYHMNP